LSLLIREFEDHGRERERKSSEAGILFKQRRNAVPVFVKAKFIHVDLAVDQVGLDRVSADKRLLPSQSPRCSMAAHTPLHRHPWSESEANLRLKFGAMSIPVRLTLGIRDVMEKIAGRQARLSAGLR
jgi:hypothetical protein